MPKTIDEAVEFLKEIVDLSKIAVELQKATITIMTGGAAKFSDSGEMITARSVTEPDAPPLASLSALILGAGRSAARGRRRVRRAAKKSAAGGVVKGLADALGSIFGGLAGGVVGAGAALGATALSGSAGVGKKTFIKIFKKGVGSTKTTARITATRVAGPVGSVLGSLAGGVAGLLDAAYKGGKNLVARAGHGRVGRWAKTGGRVGKALGVAGTRLFGGSSKTAAAAGDALGAVGAKLGAGLAGVGAVGGAAVTATKALLDWSDAAFNSAKKLAEVSGSMALVLTEREIRDMFRDMARGNATSGSARDMMEAEAGLKDALQPILIILDNAWNTILAGLMNGLIPVVEVIAEAVGFIKDLVEGIAKFFDGGIMDEVKKKIAAMEEELAKRRADGVLAVPAMIADADRATAMALRLKAAAEAAMVAARVAGMAPRGALPPFVLAPP